MNYELVYTALYEKRARRFFKKNPQLLDAYSKTLKLLSLNPHHPSLRLHRLKGELSELHSVSINLKYRITLKFIIADKQIRLINIGNHTQFYDRSS